MMATNFAVSLALSPPTSESALLTDSLKTYMHYMHTYMYVQY